MSNRASYLNSEINQAQDNQNHNQRMRIYKIVLFNFKSFKGLHEIGYFQDFTSLLGSNGSGKSNIVDSIMFALGFTSTFVRCNKLKDLINQNRNPNEDTYVEIHFTKQTPTTRNLIDNLEVCLTIKRRILENGTDYFWNKEKVKSEKYIQNLSEALNINIKSNFFIAAQGAIDMIMTNKYQLTDYIEILSNSIEFKPKYNQVKSEIEEVNDDILQLSKKVLTIKDERKEVHHLISTEESFKDLEEEMNTILCKIFLYKVLEQDNIITSNKNSLMDYDTTFAQAQQSKAEIVDKLKELNLKLNRGSQSNVANQELIDHEIKLGKLQAEIKNMDASINEVQSRILHKMSIIHQEKSEKERKEEKFVKVIGPELDRLEKERKVLQTKLNEKIPLNNFSSQQLNEYNEVKKKYENEVSEQISNKSSFTKELMSKSGVRTIKQKEIEKLAKDQKTILEKLEIIKKEKKIIEERLKKHEAESELCLKTKVDLNSKKENLMEDLQKHESSITELDARIRNYEANSQEYERRKKIEKLSSKHQGIWGFFNDLIFPSQKSFEVAVKVSLLKYLNHLVVDTTKTAKICSDYLKENDISLDIIIVENIRLGQYNKQQALTGNYGQYGSPLANFINCKKPEMKTVVSYFIKNLVYCFNKTSIQKLNELGIYNIILEDGTLLKKGMITGGNYRNLGGIEFTLEDHNKFKESYRKHESEYSSLTAEVVNINEKLKKLDIMLRDIEISRNLLTEMQKTNSANEEKSLQQLMLIEQQHNTLTSQINLLKIEESGLLSSIDQINSVLLKEKSNRFKDFFHKAGLSFVNELSIEDVYVLEKDIFEIEDKISKLILEKQSNNERTETIKRNEQILEEDKQLRDHLNKNREEKKEEISKMKKLGDSMKQQAFTSQDYFSKLKESVISTEKELEKIDQRLRALVKSKVEYVYNIESAQKAKSAIIEEFKTSLSTYLSKFESSIVITNTIDISKLLKSSGIDKLTNQNVWDVNYEMIDEEKNVVSSITALEKDFREKIEDKEKYVRLMLKTVESYEDLVEKQKKQQEAKRVIDKQIYEQVTKKEKLQEMLNEIISNRKNRFENFMNRLSQEITNIYRNLSRNNINDIGGTASIYNTNSSEPFLGQTLYLPTPPGKSFVCEFESLSGGEKTIGIVALIFALQRLTNFPFIVLDEIDSYLDPIHEEVLAALLSSQMGSCQVVSVTHKFSHFKWANTLIGTYFNHQLQTSIPISLDLNMYN